MIISDLKNLETVKGSGVIGGIRDIKKEEFLSSDVDIKLKTRIDAKANVKGNSANAEADALAEGRNTVTNTISDAFVVDGKVSASSSLSQAATSGSKYKY